MINPDNLFSQNIEIFQIKTKIQIRKNYIKKFKTKHLHWPQYDLNIYFVYENLNEAEGDRTG